MSQYKVFINTVLFDLYGSVELATIVNPNDIAISRRVNSVKTLNATSYVADFGYAVEDTELSYILTKYSQEYYDNIMRLAKLHSEFILCNYNGAFVVIISNVRAKNGTMIITFTVKGAA